MNWACRSVGKPGKGAVVTIDRGGAARRCDARATPRLVSRHLGAGLFQQIEQRGDAVAPRAHQFHLAAGDGDGDGIGAGLDAVGHHAHNPRHAAADTPSTVSRDGAQAGNLRAHRDQAAAEIVDLRLARRIADHGFALGQGRRHQRGFGGADRDEGKFDAPRP